MIDGDAYLPVTTNPAYVTATMPDDGSSVFPTALVVDEARGINWEGGAASFIDGLASDYSDLQVTQADGETPVAFGVAQFSQVAGSRLLVLHRGSGGRQSGKGKEVAGETLCGDGARALGTYGLRGDLCGVRCARVRAVREW